MSDGAKTQDESSRQPAKGQWGLTVACRLSQALKIDAFCDDEQPAPTSIGDYKVCS